MREDTATPNHDGPAKAAPPGAEAPAGPSDPAAAAAQAKRRPAPRRRRRGGPLSLLGRIVAAALGLVGAVAAIAIIALVGGVWLLFEHFGDGLPDERQLLSYFPPVTTRVHADDGRLLAEYAIERRVFVPLDRIPPKLRQAFIAAEDQHFYAHFGVDPMGVARATLANLRNLGTGRRPEGASTITQQVAKNFFLSNEASLERKLKEWVLAYRIEQTLPKDRILELYLNEIYLGFGAYGVASAALNYFAKPLEELTLGEMAYLASLPKAPNNYHPVRQKARAIERRDYTLARMREDGFIDDAELAAARAEPLTVRARDPEQTVKAEHFAEEVRRQLIARYGEEALYKGGLTVRATIDPELQAAADTALREGLAAYDRRHGGWRGPLARLEPDPKAGGGLGDWAKRLDAAALPPGLDEWRRAVVLELDDKAAEIGFADGAKGQIAIRELAWARPQDKEGRFGPAPRRPADVLSVGDVIFVEPLRAPAQRGRPAQIVEGQFRLRQIPEVSGALAAIDVHTGRVLALAGGWSYQLSEFNRATQAQRQPGSSFKPYVYLAALENGFTPSTIVLDAPYTLTTDAGKWRPENATNKFYGPAPLRVGLEASRNLMTVRVADEVGVDKVAEMAVRLGVADRPPPVMSMALGALETTVLRQTAAYAMIANGGRKLEPSVIDRVQDRDGRTIWRHDPRECAGCADPLGRPNLRDPRPSVLDPAIAYQMTLMLQGVIERGTGAAVKAVGKPLAGKTGTTNDVQDAWFVGYSADIAVGVYVGYDTPRPLGRGESGGTTAAPIFRDFMAAALKDQPARPFRTPPGVSLVRVSAGTGAAAGPGDRDAILDAFRPGQEPGQGAGPAGLGSLATQPAGGGAGLGGLY